MLQFMDLQVHIFLFHLLYSQPIILLMILIHIFDLNMYTYVITLFIMVVNSIYKIYYVFVLIRRFMPLFILIDLQIEILVYFLLLLKKNLNYMYHLMICFYFLMVNDLNVLMLILYQLHFKIHQIYHISLIFINIIYFSFINIIFVLNFIIDKILIFLFMLYIIIIFVF